jgi:hypothetical protein
MVEHGHHAGMPGWAGAVLYLRHLLLHALGEQHAGTVPMQCEGPRPWPQGLAYLLIFFFRGPAHTLGLDQEAIAGQYLQVLG